MGHDFALANNSRDWFQLWLLLYLLPGGGLSLIFWRSSLKRFKWNIWDLALFVMPFLVWLLLYQMGLRQKTVNNYFEVLLLSGALFICVSLRVLIGRLSKNKSQSLLFLFGMCGLAVVIYYYGFTAP